MKKHQQEYMKQPGVRERRNAEALEWYHSNGIHRPLADAKDSALWLGVHVAERALSNFFDNVTRMPCGHPGYDFVCGKGYKIDVKSACRSVQFGVSDKWIFVIRQNNIPDYFLCIAFDNRDCLTPEHVWLIPGKDINNKKSICVSDNPKVLKKWECYERPLDRVVASCNSMKADHVSTT